ncbi:hypothetical protein SS50377_22759 [Spironucleus salmonicida]|uniref:Uncharacterized protein n=1 Tax=Spironucleus salmonicida TaxID=348837 RepID=V6LDG0_9EUKA|nr:hypothetical protein SS50377_22759 [Spironucleus salmonicida]|eukprot:EST42278.1 Hypothetical protein SS50377_18145 [Spironucleus salmonicida]
MRSDRLLPLHTAQGNSAQLLNTMRHNVNILIQRDNKYEDFYKRYEFTKRYVQIIQMKINGGIKQNLYSWHDMLQNDTGNFILKINNSDTDLSEAQIIYQDSSSNIFHTPIFKSPRNSGSKQFRQCDRQIEFSEDRTSSTTLILKKDVEDIKLQLDISESYSMK